MDAVKPTGCCPVFDPGPWDEKEITWERKAFVVGRVRSFFHVPLNIGPVVRRNMELIRAAGGMPEQVIVLSDENSLWGADIYIAVSKDVPGARMTSLSGTFLTRVFEGPYRNMRRWMEEMKRYVDSQGRELKRLLFYYTTCPKCAKSYGRNYVVLVAEV